MGPKVVARRAGRANHGRERGRAYWFVSPGRPSMGHVPYLEPRAVEIIPGVHLLGSLDPAAAYAVETSEGLVLIDTGIESGAGTCFSNWCTRTLIGKNCMPSY